MKPVSKCSGTHVQAGATRDGEETEEREGRGVGNEGDVSRGSSQVKSLRPRDEANATFLEA